MKAREGDLIETNAGHVFDVKGLVHPLGRIIAFPRFIQEKSGERRRNRDSYRKIYALAERFRFLEQELPHYLVHDPIFDENSCEVPVGDVKRHYEPAKKLGQLRSSKTLDTLETEALKLAESLKEATNISWADIGVSGSILAGLHTTSSDIDPIIYRSESCRKVHTALSGLLKEEGSQFKPYNQEQLRSLFDFRSKDTTMGFEDFVRTESRKVMQGKFGDKDYFIRFVKDWKEIDEDYGDIRYRNSGYVKLKATIVDDSDSVFTPCTYRVGNVRILEGTRIEHIEEIASFRGRFCEQAHVGETVVAQGKVEHVADALQGREYSRLLLGNKPSDFMLLAEA